MKRLLKALLLLCSLLPHFSWSISNELLSADDIMQKVETNYAVNSEIELIKMSTTDSAGDTEERTLLSIIRRDPAGNYNYLIRFLSPASLKGVTLVTRETGAGVSKQYLYLPALGKVKEIKGSEKSNYFMGTDFTFEDLRKESAKDHSYYRQFDDTVNGRNTHVILSAPSDNEQKASTGYSSRMLYIDQKNYQILKIEYYNDAQDLLKTLQAFDYTSKDVDGPTKRPKRAVMVNHETGSTSVLTLLKSRLNFEVDPNLFTVAALEAWTESITQSYLDVFDDKQK